MIVILQMITYLILQVVVMRTELRCLICSHSWMQRFPNKIPVCCPKCKRYEWKGKFDRPNINGEVLE